MKMATGISQHYNEQALRFGDKPRAAHYRSPKSFLERLRGIRKIMEGFHHQRILDIGCGAGILTSWLAASNQVIGLDISNQMLRLAAKKSLTPVLGDAFHLPFQKNTFDTVLSMEMIQHVSDPFPFLEELLRVSSPGAVVMISSLNRESFLQKALWHLGITNRKLFFHERTAIVNFLSARGVEAMSVQFSAYPLPVRWTAPASAVSPFSSFWMLSGRKRAAV